MLGTILDIGSKLVGGLLGGESSSTSREKTKSKSRQSGKTVTKAHLGQLVRQAEKHGFNPLTVLSAGGLGAYATSSTSGRTVSTSKSRGKNTMSSSAPLGAAIAGVGTSIGNALNLSSSNLMGDGVGAPGLPAWQDYGVGGSDPIAAKSVEHDLLRQQLGGNPGANATSEDGGSPMLPGSSTWWQATPWMGKNPTFEEGTVTNPWPRGSNMPVDSSRQDADSGEQRYSELGGLMMGIQNFAADRRTNPDLYDKSMYNFFKDGYEIFNAADKQLLNFVNDNVPGPTADEVKQKAQSYWDTFEDTYDKSVAEVRSVVAPYIQYQFTPPMEYIGAVDRAGYPRPKW